MKILKYTILSLFAAVALTSCGDDDDNGNIVAMDSTCSDGIMNQGETGVDCGGPCTPCETMGVDFSGTYNQVDIMGRAAINTVLGISDPRKDDFNSSTPAEQSAFASEFTDMINGYHAAFGVTYENNILGLTAEQMGGILALDVLQVAPEGPTTYFDPGTGGLVPDGDETVLTGRRLTDDVVDVSLILLFGGMEGQKYNGENGTPELVSDNVGFDSTNMITTSFPYMGEPNN